MLWIIWNPDRNFFTIPFLHHPVTWYGVLFALGFFGGYYVIRKLFQYYLGHHHVKNSEEAAMTIADRLAILSVLGTLVGARLGHVFFYGWPYYRSHPTDILKLWEGGLASHGAAIGIIVGLIIFVIWERNSSPRLTFLTVLDAIVVAAALAGGCIRIGNFINQEILGMPTSLPWGVIFLDPVEGPANIPLHPVQLYESLFYFAVFAILLWVWYRQKKEIGSGLLSGLFFTLVFGFRFLIEYIKLPQSEWFDEKNALLNMGQILSIPFFLLGLFFLARLWYRRDKKS